MFNAPFSSVNYAGFEQLKISTGGGSDSVEVHDLPGIGPSQVRVDLGLPSSADTDELDVALGDTSARARVLGSPCAEVTVSGMAGPVLVCNAEKIAVIGGFGNDVIDASRVAAGTLRQLLLFGYSNAGPPSHGHDILIGSPGDDFIASFDDGGDRIEGRGGNDELFGRSGDDQIFGGDGDDFPSGLGGHDILDGGTGNNVIIP